MPSSRVACPWCIAHPTSEQYFGHLYSKHYSLLWSGKSLACLKLRIKNQSIAPVVITLPDNHIMFACLGCISATTSFITAAKHEISCSESTLKAFTKLKFPEEPAAEISKKQLTELTDKLIDKVNLKINTMRKSYLNRIREIEFELNELKKSEEIIESEDEDEYDFRDEFSKFLKGLGL